MCKYCVLAVVLIHNTPSKDTFQVHGVKHVSCTVIHNLNSCTTTHNVTTQCNYTIHCAR